MLDLQGAYDQLVKVRANLAKQGKSISADKSKADALKRVDSLLPAMKAHGMPPLMAHLRGEISLEAAAELGKRDTRRYAKRQFTWMANQMPAWTRVESEDEGERVEIALRAIDAAAAGT